MPATAGKGFILRWMLSLVFVFGWSQTSWALNCQEVRQLTLLYFKMHYSHNAFDQALGGRTLDTFIKAWDPAKLYFYQADVDEFTKKYGTTMHKMVNQADCSAIDDIMARYSRRFEERQKIIFKQIDDKHDFTKDEYMVIDTKKTPWAKNVEELNERWRQRVKFQLLTLKSSLEDQSKAREKLKKRFELSQKRHNELNKDKVYGVFMNAFSTSLDPHSSYMPSDELEDFRIRTRLSLEGIGASLRSEDGFTIVVSLVKGGAAEKSGSLKVGDKIIAVAQGDAEPVDVIDMELQEVVKLIRGARGTTVKLTIMRKEAKGTEKRVVGIIREKIQLEDQQASSKIVTVEVIDPKAGKKKMKVGVLKLPSFYIDFEGRHKQVKNYRSSSQDTKRELAKLQKEKVDAVVMDLRNNGGGSLEESINMAGLFFDKGPVVQVKAQNGQTEAYYDRDGETSYKGPLVVIINRHSASASEIFAGAIQDYERGVLVGDSHTFGKGTVQNLNDVAARLGAVKVTVNKFYRASGASTQLDGVSSDIRLPSIVDELEIGEKYYDYALPFEKIRAVDHQDFGMVKPYLAKLKARSDERVTKDPKFKEITDEIAKYRKNEKERNRVSLQEKKGEKKDDAEADPEIEEPVEQTLAEDTYLQEAVRIATDYAQLMQKKEPGSVTIPEVVAAQSKGKKEVKVSKSKEAVPTPGKKAEDKDKGSKALIK